MAVEQYGLPQLPEDLTHTSDWHANPDYTLQMLADFADRWGRGFTLTLVVSGGVISGTVESRPAFLRGCAEKIREFDAGGNEDVQKAIDQFADDVFVRQANNLEETRSETLEAEKDLKEGEDTTPPTVARTFMHRHIHLSDTWWYPGGAPAIELGHTRVLLSHVAA